MPTDYVSRIQSAKTERTLTRIDLAILRCAEVDERERTRLLSIARSRRDTLRSALKPKITPGCRPLHLPTGIRKG